MSDQYFGQKMIEEEDLHLFLDAYRAATDQTLEVVDSGESPDFICRRPTGDFVGVELTRPQHDYQQAVWDKIWAENMEMDTYDLLDAIHAIVAQKARMRLRGHWRLPASTILVVKLVDYTFASLRWFSQQRLASEFASAGFIEIWVADHTTLDAYGAVRLVGLYPSHVWGVHCQNAFHRKPYG